VRGRPGYAPSTVPAWMCTSAKTPLPATGEGRAARSPWKHQPRGRAGQTAATYAAAAASSASRVYRAAWLDAACCTPSNSCGTAAEVASPRPAGIAYSAHPERRCRPANGGACSQTRCGDRSCLLPVKTPAAVHFATTTAVMILASWSSKASGKKPAPCTGSAAVSRQREMTSQELLIPTTNSGKSNQ
jgi:hypothetical protein